MKGLYIVLGLLAFTVLLLALRVRLNFVYKGELLIYLKVLFIKIKLFPQKKKKFNAKKHERKMKKKEKRPNVVLKDYDSANADKLTLLDNIKIITDVISTFFKAFAKYLRVKVAKIHVKVSTGDAAQTAILYGAVSGALACMLDTLNDITNLKAVNDSAILIEPDFVGDKTEAVINISLSLSVWGALITLIKSLLAYISAKNKFEHKPKG